MYNNTVVFILAATPLQRDSSMLWACGCQAYLWLVSSPNFYALIVFLGLMPILGIAVPVHTDASHDLSPAAVLSKPCFQPRTVNLLWAHAIHECGFSRASWSAFIGCECTCLRFGIWMSWHSAYSRGQHPNGDQSGRTYQADKVLFSNFITVNITSRSWRFPFPFLETFQTRAYEFVVTSNVTQTAKPAAMMIIVSINKV